MKRHNDNCQRLCSVASCLKTHLTLSPLLSSPSFFSSLCSPAGHSVYQLAVMMVPIFARRGDLRHREAGGSATTVPTPPSTTPLSSTRLSSCKSSTRSTRGASTTSSTYFPRLLQQLDLPGHSLWHARCPGHHHRVWRPGLQDLGPYRHTVAGLLCECCKFLFSVYSTKKKKMSHEHAETRRRVCVCESERERGGERWIEAYNSPTHACVVSPYEA